MTRDQHIEALSDLLIDVLVREIQATKTAQRGKEKARTDGNPERAKGQNNGKDNTEQDL